MTVRITDETTRHEIAEALSNMCARAQREMPVVGTEELPTPWDKRHAALDELLTQWSKARA